MGKIMEKIRIALLYAGVDKADYEKVRPKIASTDRTMVQVISALATVLIVFMFVSTLFVGGVKMNRAVYGAGSIVSLVLFISSIALKEDDRLVMPMVYISYSIFYIYGIMIGAITDPGQKTVTFMVMLVFLPVLFVGRPIYSMIVTLVYVIIFIGLCFEHKTGGVLGNDVIDAIIFGMLGIISGTILSCVKVRGYVLEGKLKTLNARLHNAAHIDLLTGMQNRNAYERDIYNVAKECETALGCVYIDVNGLKHVNDNYGHEKGDAMLKSIAAAIKEYYGDTHAYRVGGDEFVIFVPDPGDYELKNRSDNLCAKVEAMDYHVAVGWKIHDLGILSVKDLIKEAEKYMSDKKTEFYEQADFDRRKN